MLLLVGLGNPGQRYAGHRHNLGYMVVDGIVRRHSLGPWRPRFRGETAEGRIGERRAIALKPSTWMNLSGEAVGEAARFYRVAPGDICVIHDDLDLAPGKVKVKSGGGAGGHNGLKSLDRHIGRDYWRIRIGIGHPGDRDLVERYVLSDIPKAEAAMFGRVVDAVGDAFELFAGEPGQEAAGRFMSRVSLILNPPEHRPPPAGKPPRPGPGDDEPEDDGPDDREPD